MTYTPVRVQRLRTAGWKTPLCGCGCGEPARYVGRGSRWGNPFRAASHTGLARVPAVRNPGRDWEYEGRISAAGIRHDYQHSDGTWTKVTVRTLTPTEAVECYAALLHGDGRWPLDGWTHTGVHHPHLSRIAELTGHDLSCWCKPGQPCHADLLLTLANPRKAD